MPEPSRFDNIRQALRLPCADAVEVDLGWHCRTCDDAQRRATNGSLSGSPLDCRDRSEGPVEADDHTLAINDRRRNRFDEEVSVTSSGCQASRGAGRAFGHHFGVRRCRRRGRRRVACEASGVESRQLHGLSRPT